MLTEGGNVFKDEAGAEGTRRINQADVPTTIQWLEQITGLDFSEDKDENEVPTKWLGTTGRKSSSGDLDLSVDDKSITKEVLADVLTRWCVSQGIPQEQVRNRAKTKTTAAYSQGWVAMSGDSVHFKAPINGNVGNGFVQVDFMFGDPKWQAFAMKGGREGSQYVGMSRHIILASIVTAIDPNLKWSYKNGIVDRTTNQTIEGGKDPRVLSKLTGIPIGKLNAADDIIDAVSKRPDYQKLIAAARDTLAHSNIQLPESAPMPGTAAWFRSLGHRI